MLIGIDGPGNEEHHGGGDRKCLTARSLENSQTARESPSGWEIAAMKEVIGGLKLKILVGESYLGGQISRRWHASARKWLKLWNTD